MVHILDGNRSSVISAISTLKWLRLRESVEWKGQRALGWWEIGNDKSSLLSLLTETKIIGFENIKKNF